jgi:hypothetical protein
MTERDKSSEGFLERWSRKKIEAERDPPPAPDEAVADDAAPERIALRQDAGDRLAPAAPQAEFDLSKLPSLDSITAATDIRGFLSPGVPKEIARAALRRAWASDPAIRDFKGLAENDWDFTDPTAMPGFGSLPEGYDVKKMVAQIFGEGEKPAEPDADQPPETQIAQETSSDAAGEAGQPKDEALAAGADQRQAAETIAQDDVVRRTNIIASHNSNPDDESVEHQVRRQHGGALPQ